MSDNTNVRVTATDEASPVLKEVSDSVKGIGDSTQGAAGGVSSGMNEIVTQSTRGAFAMKGFHFAAHEAFAEMGVGGRMARALGTETEHLAGALGTAASILGGVAMAGVIGYQVYEHFTKAAEEKKKAVEASTNSLFQEIKTLYQYTDATGSAAIAVERLTAAKVAELKLTLPIKIKEENEALEKSNKALVEKANLLIAATERHNELAAAGKLTTSSLAQFEPIMGKWVDVSQKHLDQLKQEVTLEAGNYRTKHAGLMDEIDLLERVNTQKRQDKPTTPKADKSEMSNWDAELSAQKLAFEKEKEQQGEFQKWSLQQDLVFWQAKANGRKGSEEDRLAAGHKANDTERQIIDQRNQEELGAMKIALDLYRKNGMERVEMAEEIEKKQAQVYGVGSIQHLAALKDREQAEKDFGAEVGKMWDAIAERERLAERHSVDMKKEALNTKVALGQINRQEELAQLLAFENDSWKSQQQELETEKKGLDQSSAAYEQWLTKRTQLYQKHELEIQKLRNQGMIAEQQELKNALQPMTSAFQTSLNGMMMGTQTFAATMKNMFRNVATSFLQDLVMTNLKNWIMGENQKTAISVIFAAMRKLITTTEVVTNTTADAEQLTAGMIAAKAEAVGEIPAFTGIAAISAASSVAGIPIIGPSLAATAFSAMQDLGLDAMSMVAFHVGGVASSPSGYQFPAMIEDGERILTPEQNSIFGRLDNFISNGGQGGGTGGNVTHNLKGLDPNQLYSGSDFIKTVKRLARDGHINVRFN